MLQNAQTELLDKPFCRKIKKKNIGVCEKKPGGPRWAGAQHVGQRPHFAHPCCMALSKFLKVCLFCGNRSPHIHPPPNAFQTGLGLSHSLRWIQNVILPFIWIVSVGINKSNLSGLSHEVFQILQ